MKTTLKELVYEMLEKDYGKILAKDRIARVDFEQLDVQMPLDDKETFALFQNGSTTGTRYFGYRKMRLLLKDAKPTNINELAALIALWRPGPLSIGLTEQYVKMKNSPYPFKMIAPALDPILRETYGCIVFQEQTMMIARKIGGFSMKEADLFRQTLNKGKSCKEIKERFIKGAEKQGISKGKGGEIFNLCRQLTCYSFSKAYALTWALVDYQIMYQKAKKGKSNGKE